MPMDKRDPALRDEMARIALALPGVFETTLWGRWAYKVPDPKGKSKGKLLTCLVDGKNHGWHAQFKLSPERAEAVIAKWKWIEEHPWKTLGPSGWMVARPRDKKQMKVFAELLAESRALLPDVPTEAEVAEQVSDAPRVASGSKVASRIDAVVREMKAKGWRHYDDDDEAFDD